MTRSEADYDIVFLKFYAKMSPRINLYVHVKVEFIAVLKMYVLALLGKFVLLQFVLRL